MGRNRITHIIATAFMCAATASSAVRQHGIALLQNSGRQPLPQVTVMVSGAAPATSDSHGQFSLHFATRNEGDAVRTVEIGKTGYELVNTREVELWNISATDTFTVVLCPRGSLAESRRRYYKLGEDRYRRLYRQKLAELDKALTDRQIIEQQYREKIMEAGEQLQRALDRLEEFCDRFARINRDMLSELDRRALALLDTGDIDGAIKVYEEARLLETFNEKRLLRDSIAAQKAHVTEKVMEEIRLLEREGSQQSLARRDSLLQLIEK